MQSKNQYPENWVDTVRPAILKRDNYKCCHCGIKHRSYILVDSKNKIVIIERDEFEDYKKYGAKCYRVYLQISHQDQDKTNNNLSNLKALCPRCHLAFDKPFKKLMSKAKLKPSFDWVGVTGDNLSKHKLIGNKP